MAISDEFPGLARSLQHVGRKISLCDTETVTRERLDIGTELSVNWRQFAATGKDEFMRNIQRSFEVGLAVLAISLTTGECRALVTLPESRDGISVQVETNGEYDVQGRAQ